MNTSARPFCTRRRRPIARKITRGSASPAAAVPSLPKVLLLWDRLLGYDSLELLPVLAAAVLVFRADLVMQVRAAGVAGLRQRRFVPKGSASTDRNELVE